MRPCTILRRRLGLILIHSAEYVVVSKVVVFVLVGMRACCVQAYMPPSIRIGITNDAKIPQIHLIYDWSGWLQELLLRAFGVPVKVGMALQEVALLVSLPMFVV
jgi:hypothetical protein